MSYFGKKSQIQGTSVAVDKSGYPADRVDSIRSLRGP